MAMAATLLRLVMRMGTETRPAGLEVAVEAQREVLSVRVEVKAAILSASTLASL